MELIETSEWCARRTYGAFREGVWLSAWLELKLEKTEYWEERVMTIRLNGSVSTIAIVLAASFLGIAPAFAAEQEAAKKPVPEQKAAEPKQKTGEEEAPAEEINRKSTRMNSS